MGRTSADVSQGQIADQRDEKVDMQELAGRRMSDRRVDLDCPSGLLEILWARHVWALDVLPDIPPLTDWAAETANEQGIVAPRPSDAHDRCLRLWANHARQRTQSSPSAGPIAPQSFRTVPSSATEQAMRAFVSATRQRALSGVRRLGPVTSDALLAALAQQVDVPANGDVVIDVLPVGRPLCRAVSPTYFVSDLTIFTGAGRP